MKLNKKLQLGLLFVLYLSRSGRTTLESAAEGLGVSRSFLEQVARTLRVFGHVKAFMGPTGGYELVGDPTVGQIFAALAPVCLISPKDMNINRVGGQERRSLNHLAVNLTAALNPLLNRKVKAYGQELAVAEITHLNRLPNTARAN